MHELAQQWDACADAFDVEADHGLRDPVVRAAWSDLLLPLIPAGSRVADIGCGTGTLSVLLAGSGHTVTGVDISPRMVALARAKAAAAGVIASFAIGDADQPPLVAGGFDVVISRHVLWLVPQALPRWLALLDTTGMLILVEGRWSTGAGLSADEARALVLAHRHEARVRRLDDPAYWGGPITDERYLLTSSR